MREMHDKGPVGALSACSTVALALAQKHEQQGWRVRRVSTKVRNPAAAQALIAELGKPAVAPTPSAPTPPARKPQKKRAT